MAGGCTHIIVAGGGASGVLLACHLLREGGEGVRVTLLEKRASVGLGTAYSTSHPRHLLNVRASNMSAFADDPSHFQRWLTKETRLVESDEAAAMVFAPRNVYGHYISSLIDTFDPDRVRLETVHGEVTSIVAEPAGVKVQTASGKTMKGDVAVLATGFSEAGHDDATIHSPWSQPAAAGLAPDASVLILGTGLTMVDLVIELRSSGHTGPIYAMSRRGLLSQTHCASVPLNLAHASVPYGKSILQLWCWLRRLCEDEVDAGRDWRGAIDGIRPFTAELWRQLPLESKRRFLRHARPWWDIHRHRMAPAISAEIASACAWDHLQILAAKVLSIKADSGKAIVHFRRRGQTKTETMEVARVFPCMGVSTNPAMSKSAAIQSLVRQGLARADELGLGLDIAENCALRDVNGEASQRLFAVGPITRGAYWEMIAVPDIRLQCAKLAHEIIRRSKLRASLPLAS